MERKKQVGSDEKKKYLIKGFGSDLYMHADHSGASGSKVSGWRDINPNAYWLI
jgi:hypothetical protein